ncbi:MAG TPA: MBL fold metallo-hydrolase, partial [Tianweitania sediminis]|nr:MBL fold metallo-hydrolase [Tianweitania sediminis]
MAIDISTLHIIEPYPGIFAYYDGRVLGKRLYSDKPNWLDDGAYELGSACYAILDGGEALVYDTHMSLEHARFVRDHLQGLGVTTIRVVLSHWHADHVAGNAIFQDCDIIALALTAKTLEEKRASLATREPPIDPLVIPTRTFESTLALTVGGRRVELHHFNIHSADGNVLWLPDNDLLLAGDTLEDTVTYLSEPESIPIHIRELQRMRRWPIRRILPNHGSAERVAAGGYSIDFIDANRRYLKAITGAGALPHSLKELVAKDVAAGAIDYFAPYEAVHRRNLEAVQALR